MQCSHMFDERIQRMCTPSLTDGVCVHVCVSLLSMPMNGAFTVTIRFFLILEGKFQLTNRERPEAVQFELFGGYTVLPELRI